MEEQQHERSYVDGLRGRQLSWALFQEENPELTLNGWDDRPHPLTVKLDKAHGRHGLDAWAVWRRWAGEDRQPDSAVVKWMLDGGFRGVWSSNAAFCAAQFGPSLLAYMAEWLDGPALGFPRFEELSSGDVSDLFDWDEWAGKAMNRRGAAFMSIERPDAVYVFDVSAAASGTVAEVDIPAQYVTE